MGAMVLLASFKEARKVYQFVLLLGAIIAIQFFSANDLKAEKSLIL